MFIDVNFARVFKAYVASHLTSLYKPSHTCASFARQTQKSSASYKPLTVNMIRFLIEHLCVQIYFCNVAD